jgi:hypothetical protein
MNTIGLLLVLGLAFYALKQKSQKTRNMLLVVSALIGFCMFSAEGFTVTANQDMSTLFSGTITGGTAGTRDDTNPVTVPGGSNRYIFTGNDALNLDGSTAIPDGITCNTGATAIPGEVAGVVGYAGTFPPAATATTATPAQAGIDTYLTCVTPTTACPAKAVGATAVTTQDATCGPSKTYKTTISAATDKYTGAATGQDYKTKCCETPPGPTCPPKKTVADGAAAIKTQNDTCGNYKKYKTVDPGTTFTGVAGSPTYLENCCEDNCTTDKCDTSNLFWLLCWFNECEACKDGENEDSNCSDPDLDYVGTYIVGGAAALLCFVAIVAVITGGKKSASK